jgi:hypothetical protein
MLRAGAVFLLAAGSLLLSAQAATCPPPNFSTVENFDLAKCAQRAACPAAARRSTAR